MADREEGGEGGELYWARRESNVLLLDNIYVLPNLVS